MKIFFDAGTAGLPPVKIAEDEGYPTPAHKAFDNLDCFILAPSGSELIQHITPVNSENRSENTVVKEINMDKPQRVRFGSWMSKKPCQKMEIHKLRNLKHLKITLTPNIIIYSHINGSGECSGLNLVD